MNESNNNNMSETNDIIGNEDNVFQDMFNLALTLNSACYH